MSDVPSALAVVVTGGAGDIGAAIARELLRYDATVTLFDRLPRPDLADLVPDPVPGRLVYQQVDVRDRSAVDAALASVADIDVVIGNAAIVRSARFLDITAEDWRDQLDVNLTGCFHIGQSAARLMVARGRPGRILFVSSWVQDQPWPEIAAYSVSKAGLKMLTRSMAAELAEHGIVVNAVAPGIVNAGVARHQLETEPHYAARVARAIPLGRLQTAEQVAQTVAFLCSPAAGYLTGTVLLADGGCSLRVVPDDGRPV